MAHTTTFQLSALQVRDIIADHYERQGRTVMRITVEVRAIIRGDVIGFDRSDNLGGNINVETTVTLR